MCGGLRKAPISMGNHHVVGVSCAGQLRGGEDVVFPYLKTQEQVFILFCSW